MTLQELIREVRDLIGDEGDLYSDLVITRQLNNAQRELVEVARTLSVFTVPVTAKQASVTRPKDLMAPKEFYWQELSAKTRWRLIMRYGYPPEHPDNAADPEEVYVVGNDFYLCPTPIRDGELIIVGVPEVPDMVNLTDTPVLQGAERVMVAYAVWKLLASTEGAGAVNVRAAAQDYLRLRTEWSIAEALRNPPTEFFRR